MKKRVKNQKKNYDPLNKLILNLKKDYNSIDNIKASLKKHHRHKQKRKIKENKKVIKKSHLDNLKASLKKHHRHKQKRKIKENKKLIRPLKKHIYDNKRVHTGIMGFNRLAEGGFEKNSTNLVMGGPGTGKTIFAMQFIIEGMKSGEKCLFITFEENKQPFYNNMEKFGWHLEEYEKKGLFTFLNYTPGKVRNMLEEGGGTIESIIIKNNISRLVIDSMTSFTLLFENELQKREASLDLFNMIKKWNCTSLITFESTPEEEHKAFRALEFESDSIILLQFLRKKLSRGRYIEILKMRGTNHSKGLYRFSITRKGIKVRTTQVKYKRRT